MDTAHELHAAQRDLRRERDAASNALRKRAQREAILGRPQAVSAGGAELAREVLVIINATVVADPLQSWTFPSAATTWETLLAQDQPKTGSIAVTSSISRRAVRLHPETFRRIVGAVGRHVVVSGGEVEDSQRLWPRWTTVESANSSAQLHYEPALRSSGFPGELLSSLSATLPQQQALLRRQTMYDSI
jgi:hypothetical protein